MSLSFQVYAVVDEDDVGESFTGIGYYFPNRLDNGAGGHSDEDGEGALINNITVTYLGSDAIIPSSSNTVIPALTIGSPYVFNALYSPELGMLYGGYFDGMNIPEGYCPVQVEYSLSNPEPTIPEPTVPEPIVPEPTVPEPTPEPTPNNGGSSSGGGGGSSGGGALVAIVVVGAVILAMNNRTAIKNSFFLDEKGMGFDLNKDIKFRIASYLPNKHIHVSILSLNVNLNKSIDFGLKSTFVSTGKQRVNASLVYSF